MSFDETNKSSQDSLKSGKAVNPSKGIISNNPPPEVTSSETQNSTSNLHPEKKPSPSFKDKENKNRHQPKSRLGRGNGPNSSYLNPDRPIIALTSAAAFLGLHPRTLRIYEEQKLVVPYHTSTARRLYSENDLKKFEFIQFLTRERGVNISGVKIILTMLDELRKYIKDPEQVIFPDFGAV